jgi:hypothetical protein
VPVPGAVYPRCARITGRHDLTLMLTPNQQERMSDRFVEQLRPMS